MESKLWCFLVGTFFAASALVGFNVKATSVIQFSAATYSVTEGTNQVVITVQRSDDLDTVVSVDFTTTNLSATAGLDYLDVVTNLTFHWGRPIRPSRFPS